MSDAGDGVANVTFAQTMGPNVAFTHNGSECHMPRGKIVPRSAAFRVVYDAESYLPCILHTD